MSEQPRIQRNKLKNEMSVIRIIISGDRPRLGVVLLRHTMLPLPSLSKAHPSRRQTEFYCDCIERNVPLIHKASTQAQCSTGILVIQHARANAVFVHTKRCRIRSCRSQSSALLHSGDGKGCQAEYNGQRQELSCLHGSCWILFMTFVDAAQGDLFAEL